VRPTVFAPLLLVGLTLGIGVGCGSSTDDELARDRAEIEQLRHDVEQLKAEQGHHDPASLGPRRAVGSEVYVGPDETVDEVTSYGEDAVIDGHVLGNATSIAGDVHVGPTGVVDGDVVSFGGTVDVDEDAVVKGDRIAFADNDVDPQKTGIAGLVSSLYHRLVFLLSVAGAGGLVVGLSPQRVGRIAAAVDDRPIWSLALGFGTTLVLSVTALLFALTIVGLPVAFLLVSVLGLGWLMGFVGLCQSMGDRLPFAQKSHGRWFAFLVASLVLTFVGVLPIVGWLVVAVAGFVGIGAAMTSRFGGR